MMESKTGAAMDSIKHGNQSLEKLEKQYKNLEKEWSQEKERPTLRRSATEPRIDVNALQLMENSPRYLMSALQQHGDRSPFMDGTAWKVRTNKLAVMEAYRETMEAFPSGKWKGRRLFHDVEGVSEMMIESCGEEIMCANNLDDWNASGQETDQVRSIFSYDSDDERENAGSNEMVMGTSDCWNPFSDHTSSTSSSSSSFLCKDCIKKEMAAGEAEKKEEEVVVMASVQEDEKTTENGVGYQKRLRISKLWIAVSMLVLVASILLATTFKIFGNQHEMILVPT